MHEHVYTCTRISNIALSVNVCVVLPIVLGVWSMAILLRQLFEYYYCQWMDDGHLKINDITITVGSDRTYVLINYHSAFWIIIKYTFTWAHAWFSFK